MLTLEHGSKMLLEFPESGQRGVFPFIGMKHDSYLIVEASPASDDPSPVSGEAVSVRYLFEGGVLGFRSRVLHSVVEPEPFLFIAFPTIQELGDKRSEDRIDCWFQADVRAKGSQYGGLLTDISCGGCRVLFDKESVALESLTQGSAATIECRIDDGGPYAFDALVSNINPAEKQVQVGFTYPGNDDRVMDLITDYILSVQEALS